MTSRRSALLFASAVLPASACTTLHSATSRSELTEQLRNSELTFAQTMAARDLRAFATFISEDAVFINGGHPLRGKEAILRYWQPFFSGPTAPFSWKPEIAEVAADGTLGYTEGPVAEASGASTSRFFTTWQRQVQGGWRVVFDNGYLLCR